MSMRGVIWNWTKTGDEGYTWKGSKYNWKSCVVQGLWASIMKLGLNKIGTEIEYIGYGLQWQRNGMQYRD